jgi:hypothetical protein
MIRHRELAGVRRGYRHAVTVLRSEQRAPSELMPRPPRVTSLLERWLLGTQQGAVSHTYLDCYPDKFTCRFNRRQSLCNRKLFFRLAQQAVKISLVPYSEIVKGKNTTTTCGRTPVKGIVRLAYALAAVPVASRVSPFSLWAGTWTVRFGMLSEIRIGSGYCASVRSGSP